MSGKDAHSAGRGRHDRLIKDEIHDPYMARCKPVEPTVCPQCKVVFSSGRWQWQDAIPAKANELLCPACQRMRDNIPAGILTLKGDYFTEHRDEIMRLVNNKVDAQNKQHPMKRLMGVEQQDDGSCEISFTDMHLPRGVGEAIEHACKGELDIRYTRDADLVRVYWQR